MHDIEEYIRRETRKNALRDTQREIEHQMREERRERCRKTMETITFIILCFLFAIIAISFIETTVESSDYEADTYYNSTPNFDAGRIPDDDIPAMEPEVPEDYENELIESALLERSHVIENCTITYYCAEKYKHICGTGDGITACGHDVVPGVTCAVDPSVIPLGSTVMVDYGDGEILYYVADDTGCCVGGNHIDLCVETHSEALNLGMTTATVYWCEEWSDR